MSVDVSPPLWLLAELTYRCPLQCPYCSNPLDYVRYKNELTTEQWIDVLTQARELGATQLGFSGGEPLVRNDLDILVKEARALGYYTNLITSGIGLTEAKVKALKDAGLDHIQISFQASAAELNNWIAGSESFEHKLAMARAVKAQGFPMVLCFVIHRHNIDQVDQILELAMQLEADYVELATTQYYGWAYANRAQLMPTREQIERAEAVTNHYRETRLPEHLKVYYVVPDYFEDRPKPCMNGWGSVFLMVAPDGTALPCHAAHQIPGIQFPNVKEHRIEDIWYQSEALNHFRGDAWMSPTCAACPEKNKDFGGCRCQAYLLTGDASATDPVCSRSPHRQLVDQALTQEGRDAPLVFRNPKNASRYIG